MLRKKIFILFILSGLTASAQLDAVQHLPEVVLKDAQLKDFSRGFKVEKIEDSLTKNNTSSLTDVLRFHSSIYFKENGYGMVSSPSFRGTNAAHTAVIWNGININSVFTGQTDFNIISPFGYDEMAIRSGGGGVQYGSGAVGGSIHLNNFYSFKPEQQTSLKLGYGSFNTLMTGAETRFSGKKYYLNLGIDFIDSKNDYEYIGHDKKNIHGEYHRISAKMNQALKVADGILSWNSEYGLSDRNFSGSLNTIGKDGYEDENTRNLIQFQKFLGSFKTTVKAAHLYESYKYFPLTQKPLFQGGKSNTFIGGIEAEYKYRRKLSLLGKVEYSEIHAEGDNIDEHQRKTLATVFLMNYQVLENLNFGANIRREFMNDFENPFLFSADAKWKISENYSLWLNGSKNYRVPTFNDLFWREGGNKNLKPEKSYQVEIGHEFRFENFKIDLSGYMISSTDMIKWVPVRGTLWKPENISKALNKGIETNLSYHLKFRKNIFRLEGSYSYTHAEDVERKKQLIYVPFHQFSSGIYHQYQRVSSFVRMFYNGRAYTTTDNSQSIPGFQVFDLGFEYNLNRNPNITLGGTIKNLMNVYYENVAYRPMPSRNFQFYLNINV